MCRLVLVAKCKSVYKTDGGVHFVLEVRVMVIYGHGGNDR
jgi:hypothetical protein